MVSFSLQILATTITASMLVTTGVADFHILGCAYGDEYGFVSLTPW